MKSWFSRTAGAVVLGALELAAVGCGTAATRPPETLHDVAGCTMVLGIDVNDPAPPAFRCETVEANPACLSRDGQYRAHYVEQPGGTCGGIADTTATTAVLPGAGKPGACTGEPVRPDACSGYADVACDSPAGGTVRFRSLSTWSADGARGRTALSIARDADAPCESVYAVTFTRMEGNGP
jgi:hypothetical protein